MNKRRQLIIAAGSALALAALLSACDNRLDGRDQPNPYARDDAPPAATAPKQAAAPSAADDDGGDAGDEVVYVDPDSAGDDDWYDDGPASTDGFDPTPMDAGRGYDPSTDSFSDSATDEGE